MLKLLVEDGAVSFAPFARDAVHLLESGRVLSCGGFALKTEEKALLNPALLGRAKNISLSPAGGLKHSAASGKNLILLEAMMSRYAGFATHLVEELAPAYRGKLIRARTSFRPAEIAERKTTPLQDDKRLHVDAFPATPLGGRRILRVFANIHPSAPRIWEIGEPFAAMAAHLLRGIKPKPAFFNALLAALHITKQRRTAYDDVMLALHNRTKLDLTYQRECPKQRVAFAPGTVWLCYTDQVMHAALQGQHALEQSFYLPVNAMADPETAPLRVLERLMKRRLV